jgi:hypothetical protein
MKLDVQFNVGGASSKSTSDVTVASDETDVEFSNHYKYVKELLSRPKKAISEDEMYVTYFS